MENNEPLVDPDFNRLASFDEAHDKTDRLISDWDTEEKTTATNRKMRWIDVDITSLRSKGELRADETFIPIRTIDSNIKREKSQLVAYYKQARRIAIFSPLNEVSYNPSEVSNIETAFTKGMTYPDWDEPIFKCIDGAQTHGWDWLEIEYDTNKPLSVGLVHIGHENVLFDRKAKNIQACEEVLLRFEWSIVQLKKYAKMFSFEQKQVDSILEKLKDKRGEDETMVKVYKRFFKYNGEVFVHWYCKEDEVISDWLSQPKKLFLGRKQKVLVPVMQMQMGPDPMTGMPVEMPMMVQQETWQDINESIYPLHIYIYELSEQSVIVESKGRCFLDGPKQEAQTALWSSSVNGHVRSTHVFASPRQTNTEGTGAPKRITDTILEHGCIYDKPLEFWSIPAPSPEMVKAAQDLQTQNQEETGQIAFSVLNREDSRKTAEEISTAKQQGALLNSIPVAGLSNFLRRVYSHVWLIVQSLALQGVIKFMQKPGATGEMINDIESISKVYDIRPAGDLDVVQRAEKIQRMMAFWPVVATTPIAMRFFLSLIREMFPEDADVYENELLQGLAQMQMMQTQQNELTPNIQSSNSNQTTAA